MDWREGCECGDPSTQCYEGCPCRCEFGACEACEAYREEE